MVVTLQEEDAADIKKRDQCKSEYTKTDSSIADLKWKIKVNDANIQDLEKQIAKNTAEKLEMIKNIADVDEQMRQMKADRKEENGQFLEAKKQDKQAIALLEAAAKAFTKYYKENDIAMGPIQAGVKDLALTQQGPDFEVSQWQAPEANFKDKGHRKGEAKDIVSILSMISEDLADEIRVAQQAEAESQTRFEAAMKAAQEERNDLVDRKDTLTEMIAKDTGLKADEALLRDNNNA